MKTVEITKRKAERNPDQTRRTILDAAFKEVYLNGFQAASLDNILSDTGLTKGALYHHFPNKMALGYAIVDEILLPWFDQKWCGICECDDPIDFLQEALKTSCECVTPEELTLGCPLNNLIQEMSPIDEGFRNKLSNVSTLWSKAIAKALEKGQGAGRIRKNCDPGQVASFIVASIEGSFGAAKNAKSIKMLNTCLDELGNYLEALRAND